MTQTGHFELRGRRVWVAGHGGMVGGALVRRLKSIDCEVLTAKRAEVDLRRQTEVEKWVREHRPEAVFIAAAKVGGILANDTYPAEFLYDNMAIEMNTIDACHRADVKKMLFLGSSCIYPRLAEQPIREDSLLSGALEPTNQWYAIAKIAGIKLCQAYRRQYGCDYISAMPTNLYGPGDNYDLASSHVIAALLAKAHAAKQTGSKELVVWGSGEPLREFMYVDDLADALIFLIENYSGEEHINIGVGSDVSIRNLAEIVMRVVGMQGQIRLDRSKPDGTPRKLMDSSRLLAMGWKAKTSLEEGLSVTYQAFLRETASVKVA